MGSLLMESLQHLQKSTIHEWNDTLANILMMDSLTLKHTLTILIVALPGFISSVAIISLSLYYEEIIVLLNDNSLFMCCQASMNWI